MYRNLFWIFYGTINATRICLRRQKFLCLSCFRRVSLSLLCDCTDHSLRMHLSAGTNWGMFLCISRQHSLWHGSFRTALIWTRILIFRNQYLRSNPYDDIWQRIYLRYDYFPSFLCSAASFPDCSSEVLGIKWNLAGSSGSWDIDTDCCSLDVEKKDSSLTQLC